MYTIRKDIAWGGHQLPYVVTLFIPSPAAAGFAAGIALRTGAAAHQGEVEAAVAHVPFVAFLLRDADFLGFGFRHGAEAGRGGRRLAFDHRQNRRRHRRGRGGGRRVRRAAGAEVRRARRRQRTPVVRFQHALGHRLFVFVSRLVFVADGVRTQVVRQHMRGRAGPSR